jgi:hypothetical protein
MPIETPLSAHNAALPEDVMTTITLNHEWREIVGGQLSRLLHRQYWTGTESDIDDALQKLHQLLIDLYTTESGGSMAVHKSAHRTTDINFSAGLDVPIQWTEGDYDPTHNSRIYADNSGIGLLTANAHIATLSTTNLEFLALRRNGTETLGRSHFQVGVQNSEHSVSWTGQVAAGDYFEMVARAGSNSKISVLNYNPNIGMTIFTP